MHLVRTCLMLMIATLGLTGCWGSETPPPPTTVARFATATPAPTGAASPVATIVVDPAITGTTTVPSPTPVLITTTPLPSATVIPASPTPIPPPTNTPQPTATGTPGAVIDSPSGFLNVRLGPGVIYVPPIGTYNNGAQVEIIGKQYSLEQELWWLVRFDAGPRSQGWIYAGYTIANNVGNVPFVTAPPPPPPPPTPVFKTPTPLPSARATIDSPNGFTYVRPGPGLGYEPILGAFNNGTVVDILGKAYADDSGRLWWVVPFVTSPTRQGWILADDTFAEFVEGVPWVTVPPLPSASPTPTPTGSNGVSWTVTGRVIDAATNQPMTEAAVEAVLGDDGTFIRTVTDDNGYFSLVATARNSGDLQLTVTAPGYREKVLTASDNPTRVYNFSEIAMSKQSAPLVQWQLSGQVLDQTTTQGVSGAQMTAVLGDPAYTVETRTDGNGNFFVSGQAPDSGALTVRLAATGYDTTEFFDDQVGSRVYDLAALLLPPASGSCVYENVIDLTEISALVRLENLGFNSVATNTVVVSQEQPVGTILAQQPTPPLTRQLVRLDCTTAIQLTIGTGN